MNNDIYSVLIVDDEPIIVESLTRNIDWNELELKIVSTAHDYYSAIYSREKWRPDIIITDIVMAGKSGLDLAEYCSTLDYETQVIIISAYDDFSFAQRAMKYGVMHYVVKPIDYSSVVHSLIQIKAEIKKRKNYASQEVREKLEKKEYEYALFSAATNSLSVSSEWLNQYPFLKELNGICFSVNYYNINRSYEDFLIKEQKRMESLSLDFFKSIFFRTHEYGFSAILISKNENHKYIENRLFEIIRVFISSKDHPEIICAVSLGSSFNSPEGLHKSYKTIEKEVDYGFFAEKSCILNRREENHSDIMFPYNEIPQYVVSMQQGALLTTLSDYRRFLSTLTPSSAKANMRSNRVKITSLALKAGITHTSVGENDLDNESFMLMFDELRQYALEINRQMQRVMQLVDRIKSLDSKLYLDCDFTLSKLAGILDVNSAYLSRVFKKEMGQNFVDFQTKIRVEKSIELLLDTKLSLSDISIYCGFSDKHYFGQVFKKKTGMTPTEYRICKPKK